MIQQQEQENNPNKKEIKNNPNNKKQKIIQEIDNKNRFNRYILKYGQ